MNELPLAKRTEAARWELFNSYSLRTIRDVFLYISRFDGISRQDLYTAMAANKIKPPGKKWSGVVKDKKWRIEIEYLQACRYLKLIDETSSGLLCVDRHNFHDEKLAIISANKGRQFEIEKATPPTFDSEIDPWLSIVRSYLPASEYLWWFMDFNKFKGPNSFSIQEFLAEGEKLYLLTDSNSKGADKVWRGIDNMFWKVPYNEVEVDLGNTRRENDYTRLISKLFPSWFEDLGVVDTIKILSEFGFHDGNWVMHYPIRARTIKSEDVEAFIQGKFNNRKSGRVKVFIPLLIYHLVIRFGAPVDVIKNKIVELYQSHENRYLLERSSLQVMKYASNIRNHDVYRKLFITHRNFLRNYLTIKN